MSTAPPAHRSVWSDLRQVAFTQGFIDVGGVRTRYLASGVPGKPLLLLLHGTGGHAEAFTRNLGPHAAHFYTVAIDMIGHGWTDKPAIDYEIPTYADHAIKAIEAFGYKKALVSGESLGGWVATYIGVHHPDRADKLVLNTAGGWTAHPEVMARIKKLSMAAVADPTPAALRGRLEFLMYDKSKVNDDLVETRRAIYAQPGFVDAMRRILCLQEMDIRRRNMFTKEQYGKIKVPTLVLWTSHDPTASTDEGKQIADMIPGSKFVVMNECGHWPQFENPEEFNRIHIDFLLGR
ncbi:MAG: alpha/beta fold hydrolase [Alphaproteobacteria bacterium]